MEEVSRHHTYSEEVKATSSGKKDDIYSEEVKEIRAHKSSEGVMVKSTTSSEKKGDADSEMSSLFEKAMSGRWNEVVEAYTKNPKLGEAKLTKSEDTALHIAVTYGKADIVRKLVESMGNDASNILKVKNDKGNAALHLAAAVGNVEICSCMASKDPHLIAARNNEGETPLFLAAFNGKKEAFLCLHKLAKDNSSIRKSKGGDTILHAAIGGEYFNLAYQIILLYPDIVHWVNVNGVTPLHILASKPDSFKSSSRLRFFERIIYHCLYVEPEEDQGLPKLESTGLRYPENYETCIRFLNLIKTPIRQLTMTKCKADDEEDPRQKGDAVICASSSAKESESKHQSLYPPNYVTCRMFFGWIFSILLVILGLGTASIDDLKRKKEKHILANKIMKKLLDGASATYAYTAPDSGGFKRKDSEDFSPFQEAFSEIKSSLLNVATLQTGSTNASADSSTANQNRNANEKKDADIELPQIPDSKESNTSQKNLVHPISDEKEAQQSESKETSILIAAKMGVVEMVDKILDKFPVALEDVDCNNKNAALLAVENRQTHVYILLREKYLRDNVLRQVDNKGNNALHLAAAFGPCRPWIVSGAAFEMQWEIKWYEYVKRSMPRDTFVRPNHDGRTPQEVFTETHKELVAQGREWMTKTTESCSVVAALIATVAFATSSTVPGGIDEKTGKPILENEPVFNLFAISSLVALSCSITALVFFLSILTSRYQAKDFATRLPRILLIGLTSMFISIVAILVSFCAGHSFVITDRMKSKTLPIYAATCLPVTFFALAQLPLYYDIVSSFFIEAPQRRHTRFPH